MTKLLSVSIPTFNRADLLDKQLAWLANEIKGLENECDITVFDNCSTDHTSEVVRKWQKALDGVTFVYIRHPENIGCLPNIVACLGQASGEYVWAIGDDDPIREGTLAFVVNTLKERSDLALLYLNFSGIYKPTGNMLGEHWFDTHLEPYAKDGKAVFQYCMEKSIGAVMFLTATIYRTEHVQAATRKWAGSIKNWAAQAYWTGYCATKGSVLVTKDNYIVCVVGASQWESERKIGSRIPAKDVPEVCFKLQELGYPHDFSRRVILQNFKDYVGLYKLKGFIRPVKDWPLATATALTFLMTSVCSSVIETVFRGELPNDLNSSLISCQVESKP